MKKQPKGSSQDDGLSGTAIAHELMPLQSNRTGLRGRSHPLYLAVEGIDGTGKTTAVESAATLLRARGLAVSTVRYTARSSVIGKLITLIYHRDHSSAAMRTLIGFRPLQAVLYALNGRANLHTPKRGIDVILADRSILCGWASHVGRVPEWLLVLAESIAAPDVIAYLDIPVEQAAERIGIREGGTPGYEEDLASLQRFREDYETVIANPPRRLRNTVIARLNASTNRADVASSVAELAINSLSALVK